MMQSPMTVRLSRMCPATTSNPCVPRRVPVPCNPTLRNQYVPGASKGEASGSTWYSDGSLLEARAGTGVANGPMGFLAIAPGPHMIYRAEMYGVWITELLAQPGDSVVPDYQAAARCVSKPPTPQWSNYDLHGAAYQPISTKLLQVRWSRGHKAPQKVHSLQNY